MNTSPPSSTSSNPSPVPDPTSQLMRAVEKQALDKAAANPMAASFHLLSAHLIAVSFMLGDRVRASLDANDSSSDARRRLYQNTDLYLKFARRADRTARLAHEISPLSDAPPSTQVRLGPRPKSDS